MIRYILILTAFLILVSCETKDYKELNGKWGFNSKDGSYGEIWIDDNYVLTIEEVGYRADIYKYQLINDTIILLPLNITPTVDFYIENLDKENLKILDEYRGYECEKIEYDIKIDTTKNFMNTVYDEFGERAKTNSKYKW